MAERTGAMSWTPESTMHTRALIDVRQPMGSMSLSPSMCYLSYTSESRGRVGLQDGSLCDPAGAPVYTSALLCACYGLGGSRYSMESSYIPLRMGG